jgi:hypothetical protein
MGMWPTISHGNLPIMTTPENSTIEIEIAHEISLRLSRRNRSKKWLAHELNMDYGKVKRILSEANDQQLSLYVADKMLMLLGSSLREVISRPVIQSLKSDIEYNLKKYDYQSY